MPLIPSLHGSSLWQKGDIGLRKDSLAWGWIFNWIELLEDDAQRELQQLQSGLD
jgi:hypothetical protein